MLRRVWTPSTPQPAYSLLNFHACLLAQRSLPVRTFSCVLAPSFPHTLATISTRYKVPHSSPDNVTLLFWVSMVMAGPRGETNVRWKAGERRMSAGHSREKLVTHSSCWSLCNLPSIAWVDGVNLVLLSLSYPAPPCAGAVAAGCPDCVVCVCACYECVVFI